jgi:hypothetical protein
MEEASIFQPVFSKKQTAFYDITGLGSKCRLLKFPDCPKIPPGLPMQEERKDDKIAEALVKNRTT